MRHHHSALLFLSLLIFPLTSPLKGQTTDKETLYDMLYGRYLVAPTETPNQRSARNNLLWMSYMVDSLNPATLSQMALREIRAKRNSPKALAYLKKAYLFSDRDLHIGVELMGIAGMLEEWSVVDETSQSLLEKHPNDAKVLYTLINLYRMSGKDSLAIEGMKRLLQTNKNNLQYTLQLSYLLNQSERYEEEEKLLSSFLKENPEDRTATLQLAELYMRREAYEEAITLSKKQLKKFPRDIQAMAQILAIYSLQEKYDEVVQNIKRFSEQNDLTIYEIIALINEGDRVTRNRKNYLVALFPYKEELRKANPEEESLQELILAHYALLGDSVGYRDEAKKMVQGALKAKSAYDYYINRYLKQERTDSLLYVVHQGLKVYPKEPLFLMYDMIDYLQKHPNDTTTAVQKMDYALGVTPEGNQIRSQFLTIKADYLEQHGHWKESIPYYEEAVRLGGIVAYNNYAYMLSKYGDAKGLEKAESLAAKVISQIPDDPTYLDTYAWILHRRGAHALAKVYIESAVQNSRTPDKTILEHYALILEHLHEFEKAATVWKQMYKLDLVDEATYKKQLQRLQQLKNASTLSLPATDE